LATVGHGDIAGGAVRSVIGQFPVAPAVSTASCAPVWQAVPAPDPGVSNALFGVDGRSPRDVWAVGSQTADGTTFETLVDHFDGTAWSMVPSPNAVDGENVLFAVASITPDDVWAVGRAQSMTVPRVRGLIEHFDGTSWSIVKAPSLPGDTYLSSVLAPASNDVWVAGFNSTTSSPRQALIFHWNGRAWSLPNLPSDPGVNDYLLGLHAIGQHDVWAVGSTFRGNGNPLSLHWDGTAWKRLRITTTMMDDAFYSVTGTDTSHVWAGGTGGIYTNDTAIMAFWNGTSWTFVHFPQPGSGFGGEGQGPVNEVDALAASSTNDVWAAGQYKNWSTHTRPHLLTGLLAHWDGRSWQAWSGGVNRIPHQIAAFSDGSVWSVGEQDRQRGFHSSIDRICPMLVDDRGFSPKHSSAGLGETAAWKIAPGAVAPVKIEDTSGLIGSRSTSAAGSFTHRFAAASTYQLRALVKGTPVSGSATVAVAPTIAAAGPSTAAVHWSLRAAPASYVFDVQIMRPGTGAFVDWNVGTTRAAGSFTADGGPGRYAFRALIRRTDGGGSTQYSPPVAIRLS
jgi:hypothetical protein